MPTDTLTGRHGELILGGDNTGYRIYRVKQWEVNPTLDTKSEWGDSDGGGYTQRAPGRRGATFTAEGTFSTGQIITGQLWEGRIAQAVLYLSKPVSFTAIQLSWYFPRAICDNVTMMVNIDTEEVIGWTTSFASDGVYYAPGYGARPFGYPEDTFIDSNDPHFQNP